MADQAVPVVPAPAVDTYPDGSPIKKGANSAEFWPSEAKAVEIAKGRVKGARRACKVVGPDKKVRWATTTHPHYLEEFILCNELGWEVTEIGKVAASKMPVSATAILAAVNALPTEAERDAVRKQLEAALASLSKATPPKK